MCIMGYVYHGFTKNVLTVGDLFLAVNYTTSTPPHTNTKCQVTLRKT